MNISWNAVLTIWRTFLEIHISRSMANRPAWHLNPNKCAFTFLFLIASSSHHLPATPFPVILSAHIITLPSNDFLFLYFAFKPNHKLMGRENSRFSCLFPTSQDLGAWEEQLLSQELVLTSQDLLRKVTGVLPWTHHWLIFIGVPEGPPEGPSHQRAPQGSGNWLSFQLDERPTTGVFPDFLSGQPHEGGGLETQSAREDQRQARVTAERASHGELFLPELTCTCSPPPAQPPCTEPSPSVSQGWAQSQLEGIAWLQFEWIPSGKVEHSGMELQTGV